MEQMIRERFVCLFVLGCVGVAMAQDASETPTVSPDRWIVHDDFDDNEQGRLWRAYAQDANTCRVIETNGRLELLTMRYTQNAFAGYIADSWRLSPKEDFALRVDFHYDLRTLEKGRISIGITPGEEDPRAERFDFGVGCADLYSNYWYEVKNGLAAQTAYVSRFAVDGVLYMSYDAVADALFIGDGGYGPGNAWMTVRDLLQGQWGGRPIYLYLGGSANRLQMTPGHAYLDNLVVEKGTVIENISEEVYRFWSPVTGTHFYTMSEDEKEKLLTQSTDVWTYEGVAFRAFPDDSDPDSRPVHRFWSNALASHFYTIDEEEVARLVDEYADVWAYEGIVFYAYPVDRHPPWARPVHRFWSNIRTTHFFTMSQAEADRLLDEYADVWTYEGIAWYANE